MPASYTLHSLADLEESDGWGPGGDRDSSESNPTRIAAVSGLEDFAGLSGDEDAPTAAVRATPSVRAPQRSYAALSAPPVVTDDRPTRLERADSVAPERSERLAVRANGSSANVSPFAPTAELAKVERAEAMPSTPPPNSARPRLELTLRSRGADAARIKAAAEQAARLHTEPLGYAMMPEPTPPTIRGLAPVPIQQSTPGALPAPQRSSRAATTTGHSQGFDMASWTPPAGSSSRSAYSRPPSQLAPMSRPPAPSEPCSESPWVMPSAPDASKFPHAEPAGFKIELSMVAAIATGALAFCVIIGAFFYTREAPRTIDEMMTTTATAATTATTSTTGTTSARSTATPPKSTSTAAAPSTPATSATPGDTKARADDTAPAPHAHKAKLTKAEKADSAKADKTDGAKADKTDNVKADKTDGAKADKTEILKPDSLKPDEPKAEKADSAKADGASGKPGKKKGAAANTNGKSLEQILDELGEEQLRR